MVPRFRCSIEPAQPIGHRLVTEREEVVMKKLPILLALVAALAVASCDNNVPPTNATGVDQNLQVAPVLKPATDAEAATPPAQ